MGQAGFYGWKLLATLWVVMFIIIGFPAYGSPVINAVMAGALHLDRKTVGSVYSIYMLMAGLPGPLVAVSINRFGARRTLLAGAALVIGGALFMALVARTGPQAILGAGVLVGTGVVTGSAIGSQACLARWFVRRRALVIAILYSGGAIGGLVAAPLLNRVIAAAGGDWRAGWWLIAALAVLTALLVAFIVRERPADIGLHPDGEAPDGAGSAARRPPIAWVTRREWLPGAALGSVSFWVLLLSFTGGSAGYTLFLGQGILHLQDLGHTRDAGALAVGILSASGLIAKVILAVVGDRFDPRYLWGIFTLVFGLGLVLVVDARSMAMVVMFAICIGIGFGGGMVCMMTVLSNYYGVPAFATLSGVAIALNTTLSATTPFIAGWMYDRGLGYASSFYATAVWCFLAGVVLLTMRRPGRDEHAAG
ncbi:MAG: MFS transporter [Gammaproteobacteria bacterium]|nr:MFS transporter [Gammaproteobacteria bacterium]